MYLYRLNLLFFIVFFLFSTVGEGHSQGVVFEWETFQIRPDLALNVPVAAGPERKITFIPDGYSEISNILERNIDICPPDADRKSETKWNRFNFRHLTLTFSRYATGQFEGRKTGLLDDKQSKWDTIKSLPATFLHSPSQETFESLGRIFEPELKLGIEF